MAIRPQLEQPLGEKLIEEVVMPIPERMDPGTVFFLESPIKLKDQKSPSIAAMSCPGCGTIGLINAQQVYNGEWMICGSDTCPKEWRILQHSLDDPTIDLRAAQ